eukprot:1414841-Pyramimonas_sp.AAC.1
MQCYTVPRGVTWGVTCGARDCPGARVTQRHTVLHIVLHVVLHIVLHGVLPAVLEAVEVLVVAPLPQPREPLRVPDGGGVGVGHEERRVEVQHLEAPADDQVHRVQLVHVQQLRTRRG